MEDRNYFGVRSFLCVQAHFGVNFQGEGFYDSTHFQKFAVLGHLGD